MFIVSVRRCENREPFHESERGHSEPAAHYPVGAGAAERLAALRRRSWPQFAIVLNRRGSLFPRTLPFPSVPNPRRTYALIWHQGPGRNARQNCVALLVDP